MKGDPLHTTHSASNICHQVTSFHIMLVEEMAQFTICILDLDGIRYLTIVRFQQTSEEEMKKGSLSSAERDEGIESEEGAI